MEIIYFLDAQEAKWSNTSTRTGRFVDTVRRHIGTAIDSTDIQKPKSNKSHQVSWRR
jgi:hypothetical protein